MLLLARLDTGRPLEREQVDLTRLVVDAASDAHIAGPDHRWSLDLPEEPVVVRGDEARLHQVLANLLANARTHTPAGTSVTTVAGRRRRPRRPDRRPTTGRVSRCGCSLKSSSGSRAATRRAPGASGSTGLGLAIVAAVVRAHHGTIDVHSVPGKTEFVVKLPVNSQPSHSGAKTDT